MTDREWRITLGLCTCCGKERPVRGHRYCPECQEKGREKYYAQRRRHPERYKEYARRAAEKRRERKAAGICIMCGQPATHGLYCLKHKNKRIYYSKKQSERNREKKWDKESRKGR